AARLTRFASPIGTIGANSRRTVMTVRIGQLGTKHGHARGKWRALVTNDQVEAAGIWEPDPAAEQEHEAHAGARWCASPDDLLADPSVVAIAVEGRNDESLAMAHAAVD